MIGRRSPEQIALERKTTSPGQTQGYRLNLCTTCLQMADLAHLSFARAQFEEAQMQGVNLQWARIEGANLHLAQLKGAKLQGAEMKGADLWLAKMEEADLREAQMEGVDFSFAHLHGAFLCGANLQSADFMSSNIAETSLRSADFTGAGNLNQAAINAAWGDSATVLPQGLLRPEHWDTETPESPMSLDHAYEAWLARIATSGNPAP